MSGEPARAHAGGAPEVKFYFNNLYTLLASRTCRPSLCSGLRPSHFGVIKKKRNFRNGKFLIRGFVQVGRGSTARAAARHFCVCSPFHRCVSTFSRESTRRLCVLTCVCVCVQCCWLLCSCSSSMMVPGTLCSTGFACSIPTRMCEGE
jgi:hypothetical protein